MNSERAPGRFAESLRRLPERIPLRLKLVVALLALVAVALTVISAAGVGLFRNYLTGQADQQIYQTFQHVAQELQSPRGLPLQPGDVATFGSTEVILRPPDGQLNVQRGSPIPEVPRQAGWLARYAGQAVTVPGTGGSTWRVVTQQQTALTFDPLTGQEASEKVTLIVGEDLGTVNSAIARLVKIDIFASLAIMVALALAGVAAVRSSLRPLADIEHTARTIAAGDLSRRVPDRDPRTEVGSLGRSLNTMLAKIEMAFEAQARSETAARESEERMRRFIADASHELRTPLTAIRGYAEYYRQRGGAANGSAAAANGERPGGPPGSGQVTGEEGPITGADMNRIMQRVEQESARMGVLVEDLLLLARLDQQRPLDRRPVDLLSLAADSVQDARMIAPGRAIDLSIASGTAFLVLGDEVRLRQVLGNLMSNALTHTPDGTPVHVRLSPGSITPPETLRVGAEAAGAPAGPPGAPAQQAPAAAAVLEVADEGPGMTPGQAERAFERFYRADQARGRQKGGAGLGLAIVAALVAAHGGSVAVETAPGHGAVFRITLPLAPEVLA